MPDPDDSDEQDLAEAFDETHREDEDLVGVDDEEESVDPDLDDSAYDATSAEGDEDEYPEGPEDLDFGEADDDADAVEGEPDDDLNDAFAEEAIEPGADEAELTLTPDLDAATDPRDRDARHYESSGPLSDEQIADLGYGKPDRRR